MQKGKKLVRVGGWVSGWVGGRAPGTANEANLP
jgi:hypothetical protein